MPLFKRDDIEELLKADLWELGRRAYEIRLRTYGKTTTFISNMVLNYTNVCVVGCSFCAFYRPPGHPESYVYTVEEAVKRVLAIDAKYGIRQVLIQGGVNPDVGIEYFEALFRAIKTKAPHIAIHALSPLEIDYLSRRERATYREVLERLREAGMDSMPGGGGEILVDRVRKEVAPRKIDSSTWLRIMEEAHKIGIPTSATMMYGHVETISDIAEHMYKIAELQEKTKGFLAFIAWNFEPGTSELGKRIKYPKTSATLLRIIAVARIVFDGIIPHIQSGWLTTGPETAQLAMYFGADDFGGTLYEEKVLEWKRVETPIDKREDVIQIIRSASFTPAERDNMYNVVKVYG
ncbi:Radical SAM domain protein [Pyrobaculum islandicum DSM 4184]|uniref:Cyclic dehypoxanthine futalosine synthase n=1 Tax=Pyrobaculum islandicum (strain DSM 4184 / JCM 9189 / GEO3) TaxID=384616 RepID=A1RU55_PYRIL|nr:cyclic dehypoxanthinyl futalosine synthase [Pyrobaculum islandicum]ABL88487.1 Radical SAM domain protein [Pyrobaculum islandicum DSM 4184]